MGMIICIESGTISGRGKGMMVQDQIQLTVRRTQRDMMGAVRQRHQRERPRKLARARRRKQEKRHEWPETAHHTLIRCDPVTVNRCRRPLWSVGLLPSASDPRVLR